MNIVETILLVIYGLVCFALVVLALIQSKEDDGASGAIMGGTGSSSSFYEKNKGRTREGKLKRWTIILGVAFFVLSIGVRNNIHVIICLL